MRRAKGVVGLTAGPFHGPPLTVLVALGGPLYFLLRFTFLLYSRRLPPSSFESCRYFYVKNWVRFVKSPSVTRKRKRGQLLCRPEKRQVKTGRGCPLSTPMENHFQECVLRSTMELHRQHLAVAQRSQAGSLREVARVDLFRLLRELLVKARRSGGRPFRV
jgi:hypothetical protein